jgi:hypothetical protein
MWRGLETGERRAFSESFQPFRAEPHKFYIYRQYTNIVFILQYNLQKQMLFDLIMKKITETPFSTSTVFILQLGYFLL